MRWWHPAPDEPELLDWWRPLLTVSRLARDDGIPWTIHLEDFDLVGRVRRSGRPDVWSYRFRLLDGPLWVDDAGGTYRLVPTAGPIGTGRLLRCELRRALWAAGVPYADPPREPPWNPPFDDELELPEPPPPPPALRLVR